MSLLGWCPVGMGREVNGGGKGLRVKGDLAVCKLMVRGW